MKQFSVTIPDNKVKFFLKLLNELGFVKIAENHYELKADFVNAEKRNNQKQSKIGKKERDLVTKRINSAKKSDFI